MSFTVRFLNYAGDDLLGTATVEWGEDATPLAPTPEIIAGKKFTGWNVPITHVVEDMTVRPTYVEVHTVTFYNYKGDGTLSVQEVEDGQDAKAPKEEKIAGKTFTGWDTDFTNVHSDLSVHPLYTDIYLTVRFLNKDGTDVWSTQSIRYGDDAIPPSPLKYTGFIFIGWNSAFTHITEDKTIRPVYREIPPHPTLNFYEKNEDGSSGRFEAGALDSASETLELSFSLEGTEDGEGWSPPQEASSNALALSNNRVLILIWFSPFPIFIVAFRPFSL